MCVRGYEPVPPGPPKATTCRVIPFPPYWAKGGSETLLLVVNVSLPTHPAPQWRVAGGGGVGDPYCPRELEQPFPSCHLTLAESTRGWWPPALVHPQPLQFGLHSTDMLTCLIFMVEHGQRASLTPHRARAARSSTKMLIFVSLFHLCVALSRGRMVRLLLFNNT